MDEHNENTREVIVGVLVKTALHIVTCVIFIWAAEQSGDDSWNSKDYSDLLVRGVRAEGVRNQKMLGV